MAVQAQSSLAAAQPSAAEARGRVLPNLRLRDAEGGLLGRTLLTLIANKVGNAGWALPPIRKAKLCIAAHVSV